MQTKPELARALVAQARAWSVPFAYVVTDASYGDNPTCWQGLDDRYVASVVGISRTFGVCLPEAVHAAALVRPAQEAAPRAALCGPGRARGPGSGLLAAHHLARVR